MTKTIAGSTDTTPNKTTLPSGSKPESSSEPTPLQSEGDSTDLSDHALLGRTSGKGRTNAREKAKRLLVSGRLRVLYVDNRNVIQAECRGDTGGVYKLGHDPFTARAWHCNCPAFGPCSHLMALWAVTAVER